MTGQQASVLLEQNGAIATITLNRPHRRNGVTLGLCTGLYAAVQQVAASDASVCILRGAGGNFCVGADLAGADEAEAEVPRPDGLDPIYKASALLHAMPQVSIAAIDGGCAGAGMGWAMACDLRFATGEARFSTAFLAVGASGDMGTGWSLTRIVGGARARDLMFFPDKFGGERALELGLVSRLFAHDALHGEVLALAQQLAGRDPMALAMMKANMLSAEAQGLEDYIDIETARHLETVGQPGFTERMAARFRETRADKAG